MILRPCPQMAFSFATLPEILPLGKPKACITEHFHHLLRYKYLPVRVNLLVGFYYLPVSGPSSQDMWFGLGC